MKKEEDDKQFSEGGASDEDAGGDDNANKPKRRHVECIMGNKTEEELAAIHPQRTTH